MNERIKLLAEQSMVLDYSTWDSYNQKTVEHYKFDKEKFAELIVEECARYINERTQDWDADLRWIFNDGSGDMAVDVDDLLNRHFGVEE